MKTIVGVAITPAAQAHVTPLELLEDFADAAPAWHFMEDESHLYAALKGVPACVLRALDERYREAVDLAFAAEGPDEHSLMRLLVVEPASPHQLLSAEHRRHAIERFVRSFRRYLRDRTHLVDIQMIEEEQPAKAVMHLS